MVYCLNVYFFYKKMKNKNGFTLIELLVVISIIGLLSSVILASLNSARAKALRSKAIQEMRQFATMAVIAQGVHGSRLRDILPGAYNQIGDPDKDKYDWPAGPCVGPNLRNISAAHQCYLNWIDVLEQTQTATGGTVKGLENMQRDPWGSPYLFDPNEGEPAPPTYPDPCDRRDAIFSAGPDGLIYTADDIYITPIPFSGFPTLQDTNLDGIPDSVYATCSQ
ncbi:MAG: hypothetical protein A2481_03760 [Candidatus Yonathbacteria bacterium RIFOXYC2_FULL_47_9]|nr:MAG: hypothetical protein A2481_03760 [Candidatus Yonathbacteria bacterium RIFOXYC2_FULL_47_9]HAT68259.1 hypothetical protein [Candidatus Yonathbacteria bacterium]